MYTYSRNLLSKCFDNFITSSNQVHNYDTRSAANYRFHACRANIKQFTILYQDPKIWDSLPSSIPEINIISS